MQKYKNYHLYKYKNIKKNPKRTRSFLNQLNTANHTALEVKSNEMAGLYFKEITISAKTQLLFEANLLQEDFEKLLLKAIFY